MTPEEIKRECNFLYEQIKIADERLEQLRSQCLHEKTFQGYYSWRVGSIDYVIKDKKKYRKI